MKIMGSHGFVISITAVALLAACAGSQPPIGAPGTASHNFATAAHRAGSQSGSSTSLLYVVTTDSVYVLSYPGYHKVQTLWKNRHAFGPITSNPNNGDVLINVGGTLYEYAHGGQQPIGEIPALPSHPLAFAYAFDPTTNNIAVSEQQSSGGGFIAVYSTPSSNPTTYDVPNIQYPFYLGYDSSGDLFVQGRSSANGPWVFAELAKTGSAFMDISLDKTLTYMGTVQWDGSYITVASANVIYQIQVSGSSGTIVGQVALTKGWQRRPIFWIQDAVAIGDHTSPQHGGRYLGLWNYPSGGRAFKVLKDLTAGKKEWIASEAVSIAPGH